MGNLTDNQNVSVRLANDNDFERIFEIWTLGIQSSFDTSSIDIKQIRDKFLFNFSQRHGIFNYWVAVNEFDQVMGWQSLSKTTQNPLKELLFAESSTYIHKDYRKLGLGELLVDFVMTEAENSNLHYVIAFATLTNEAVRRIASETGWAEVGVLPPSKTGDNKFPKLFIVRPV